MPTKKKAAEKPKTKKAAPQEDIAAKVARQNEEVFQEIISNPGAQTVDALVPAAPPEQALTLPFITDQGTLFLQGLSQLTAQLLGTPESAPLLVRINAFAKQLDTIKKLIVGNEDAIEGLKAKVIADGEPWGENGSKQLTLAGAVVKVKAVNYREPGATVTIADLDPAKVEAYFRGIMAKPDEYLSAYMKASTVWGLKDLTPLQQKNLTALLADEGMNGQGLRQCVKDTKWQMLSPEMINE